MAKRTFFYCPTCHNMFEVIKASGVTPICCGNEMKMLEANVVDAATEKHVPAVTRDGKNLKVQVGSVAHPMEEAHYIEWILLAQGNRTIRVDLKPGIAPTAEFELESATEPVTVYEHCNLHGLWLAEA